MNRSNTEIDLHREYKLRLDKVFTYIDNNLDSNLSLETVADVACFSPFHFHRIFKIISGERLNEYITRRRIEKSAADLLHSNESITEITLKRGFSCNSAFTRTFRNFYGVSPSEFRKSNPHKYSNIHPQKSKNGQASRDAEKYLRVIERIKNWTSMNARIEIQHIAPMHVAYITVIGPQNLGAAFGNLITWATSTGILNQKTKLLTIYHDSIKITEEHKVRMSACLALENPPSSSGIFSVTTIQPGRCVVGSYEITLDEFGQAWTGLFMWMNENGYKKSDGNPFEIYHNDFNQHPEKKSIVDFCIPIQ